MAKKAPFRRRILRGLSLLSLSTLLALLIYNLHDHDTNVSKKVNVARSVETLDLESSPYHESNSTLEPRQTYQCGPGDPCSNGACCGTGGYCGYGDYSVKMRHGLIWIAHHHCQVQLIAGQAVCRIVMLWRNAVSTPRRRVPSVL